MAYSARMDYSLRADQILARLIPHTTASRDKLVLFAASWAKGERAAMRLAKDSGLAIPTVKRFRGLIDEEAQPAASAPTKLEQVNTIGQGLRDAAEQGLWADVSRLSAELSKLTGRYEPERKETVVRHYLARAGGTQAVDAEILEAQQELDRLSGGQSVVEAQFEPVKGEEKAKS